MAERSIAPVLKTFISSEQVLSAMRLAVIKANDMSWKNDGPTAIDLGGAPPLLDIRSDARRGPGRRDHLSPAQVE